MEMETINCISIHSQYAYQICIGVKKIEYRSRKTNFRGKCYIQSCNKSWDYIEMSYLPSRLINEYKKYDEQIKKGAKSSDIKISNDLDLLFRFDEYIEKWYKERKIIEPKKREYFLRDQCIIGSVEITDCLQSGDEYHYILKNPKLYKEPIPYVKGKLGSPFWKLEIQKELIENRENNLLLL